VLRAVSKEVVGVDQFFGRAAKTFSYGHAVERELTGVPQPLTRLRSTAREVDTSQTTIIEREDSIDSSAYRPSREGKAECLLEEDRPRIETPEVSRSSSITTPHGTSQRHLPLSYSFPLRCTKHREGERG